MNNPAISVSNLISFWMAFAEIKTVPFRNVEIITSQHDDYNCNLNKDLYLGALLVSEKDK